jgi:RNA polymerase sigma-70 factor, ECF subfamily
MQGDETDGELLLRRVLGERLKILPYLRSIVRRRDMAEDIFQDLCVLALKKRQELMSVPHLSGWLRTAARQLAMNALRKYSQKDLQLGDRVHDLMDRHWEAMDSTTGSSMAEALEGCVQRLAPKAKDIIAARYVEGLACGELAARLGRPVDSLYVTLSRIHKKLAKCIQRSIALHGGSHA